MVSTGYDFILKLLMVGGQEVGKSSILKRYTNQPFISEYQPTIGIEFASKVIQKDAKSIKLQIWDSAGHIRFQSITSSYYRGAMGILYVFDLKNRHSFDHIRTIHEEGLKLRTDGSQMILVGNKSDLGEERQVSYQEGMLLAEELGLNYIEVSALTGHNIDNLFDILITKITSLES